MSTTDSHLSPHLSPYDRSQSPADDYKASYDDLIDHYGSDYAKTAKHQMVIVTEPNGLGLGTASQPSTAKPTPSEESSSSKHILWGYPPVPTTEKPTARDFWARWTPESMACRLFVLAVVLETALDLTVEGELLVRFNDADADESQVNKMPVYLSIFAFAHIFQLIMAIDAVYAQNTLQFLALTGFNLLFLLYSVIQINEVNSSLIDDAIHGVFSVSVNVLTRISPIVIAVAELAFMGLGWKIYNEFGWKVYKFIGADRTLKKLYANYQIYLCLIKFDLFFFVGFSVQFIGLVLTNGDLEYYITCAALPLSVILLVEGYLAARYENRWMMGTFMIGCVSAMIYFVYKLQKVVVHRNDPAYEHVWHSLVVFAIIAVILLLATFILAWIVTANFGRGLKGCLDKQSKGKRHGRWASQGASKSSMAANPYRMSIE